MDTFIKNITTRSFPGSILLWFVIFLFVTVSGTITWSCHKIKVPKNVILITLDTQRPDYIGAYGSENTKTPNLDYFAHQGILFNNCYSPIPITVPAHASLFYSLHPHEMGLYNNGQIFKNDEQLTSLAQVFQNKGFRTAAFISLGVLKTRFRLNDGFDDYAERHSKQRWYLHAGEINAQVLPWLEQHKKDNFFIWIHYSDPHDPYAPPLLPPDLKILFNGRPYKNLCLQLGEKLNLPFRLKKGSNTIEFTVLNEYPDSRNEFRVSLNDVNFQTPTNLKITYNSIKPVRKGDRSSLLIGNQGQMRIDNPGEEQEFRMSAQGKIYLLPSEKVTAYGEEVEYLDKQIGKLIRKLRQTELIDQTMVVLVGDHGEGLGDHKTSLGDPHFGHIHFLYREYLKVPFIIYNPFLKEHGLRIEIPATILDVAPTVLSIMGWPELPFHRGISLLEAPADREQFLFGETHRPESTRDRFSGLEYPWHLIFTPSQMRYELFNVADDPAEKIDLFEERKSRPEITELIRKVNTMTRRILGRKKDVKLDPKSLEMLKSLGYIK